MQPAPLEPAALSFTAEGLPYSDRYRDVYHPHAGAPLQARHVFIQGNDLPGRWQGRERFVVLETGFGLGNNFLATWQAWREDPQRCERLVFISIEAQPLNRDELAQAQANSAWPELAAALQQAWPPLTPDLHQLDFDAGRVQLMLAFGDVQAWLPELVATVDAFYFDGFAPARNPRMWDRRVCKALSRLAAPGATLATWSAAHALREDLTTAGFEARLAPGTGGKREITLARFAPAFTPRRAPARNTARAGVERHALIVGAGLAGCSAAWALAEQGWRSTLFERRPQIAGEASGNPAGLFHGIVNAQDGVHARFNRAAASMARDAVRIACAAHGVAGAIDGLLRLEHAMPHAAMQATLRALGLPRDYVEVLSREAAGARAGFTLPGPAWFYPGGGWVDPGGLARAWLERAAPRVTLRCGDEVHALERTEAGWRLRDAAGATLAEASTVVLANAGDALRLLGPSSAADWPIDPVRGQISLLPASQRPSSGLHLPRLPIAGAGYLLPELGGGTAMFGATAQRGDPDPAVRREDHRANLAQLAQLVGRPVDLDPAVLDGRTAWRWSAVDRLPLIGAVPDGHANAARLDQPRFVPRVPGLYTFTALGSRGITWSALGARVLAALISGAPVPIEAGLIDAVDPARFISRRARQAQRG
ncbi:MAG TPA: bifunctional tRNA (5-methylaminomethyl-2-thiouridine)(34)-methyltransferase MnmD/FAD-dependent 5-carboxymethylaminomethyl-2-thiouridine(34) oxidoreductase MnmC [Burkholderiaceae bacterium]|jgi:tRNA 5-methylaminomethyl-2-thiouridine biosynthesis bifunctional protein